MHKTGLSVGIVTRTKNRAVLLRRALESVKRQTYENWRLIIVNDGGEPAPVDELVRNIFGPEENRVHVAHNSTSLGMEAASNVGIRNLETDLGVIHDDDDSWAPDYLSVATQVFAQQRANIPSLRGVVVRVNAVFETVTGNHIRIDKVDPWQAWWTDAPDEGIISLQKMMVRNQFPPIAFLFDMAVCKELGMYDESLPVLGDWEYNIRFMLKYDVWLHPEYLAFYHHRTSAQGALGNSIFAGRLTHRHYQQLLQNNWIRKSLAESPGDRPLYEAIFETRSQVMDGFNNIYNRLNELEHRTTAQFDEPVKTKAGVQVSKFLKSFETFFRRKVYYG